MTPEHAARAKKVADELSEKGKYIEAGWQGLKIMSYPECIPQSLLEEQRNMFFAGARHLLTTILNKLSPEDEATDKDVDCMVKIEEELAEFIKTYQFKNMPTMGNA